MRGVCDAADGGGAEALRRHVNVASEGERETALHLACLYGHETCAKLLLEAGSDVNARDEDGSSPLHNASAGGFVPIVSALLAAAGIDVTIADSDGDTALHASARGDHAEVCARLLAAGADGGAKNLARKAPVDLAEDREVISVLESGRE